jgi:hypothetical protein
MLAEESSVANPHKVAKIVSLGVSICLDKKKLILTVDAAKSQLKNLNFKNLDREKKISGLDVMDNLNTLKKLISTLWTFSISIALDCQDPQA